MNDLLSAMPIIVSNYAKLFGVKVRMLGSMAYTNGSIITIPRLDLNDNLSARIAYGYLAHEAAHVRYTNFKCVRGMHKNFSLFAIFNILEDARIEKIISREFIGVYENLELILLKSEDLWQQFVKEMPKTSTLRILLCSMLYFAYVKSQGFKSQRPKAFVTLRALRMRCDHHFLNQFFKKVNKIVWAKNSEDVAKLAIEIYTFIQEQASFFENKDDNSLQKSSSDVKNSLSKEQSVFDFLEDEVEHDLTKLWPKRSAEKILATMIPKNMTIKDDMGMITPGVCAYGRVDFIDSIQDTFALRHTLSQRARAWCECFGMQTQKGAKINVVRAANICAGETRIFKDRILYDDYSTSIHVLVDASGSMLFCDDPKGKNRNEEACQATLMIALALEGIDGIKTMVTFFPGINGEFDVALFAHERASNVARRFDQAAHGSTPLAQALWYAASSVKYLRCKRNIIFVLTDGGPDSILQTKTALNYIDSLGIETYGIGIKSDFIQKLIKKSAVINSVSELKNVMLKLFSDLFKIKQ